MQPPGYYDDGTLVSMILDKKLSKHIIVQQWLEKWPMTRAYRSMLFNSNKSSKAL